MRVIALPSIYELQDQRTANPQKRNRILLITGVSGFVLCFVPGIGHDEYLKYCLVLAAGWIFAILIIAFVTTGRTLSQGELGERAALQELMSLPDEYIAITNCKVPGYEQIGDLDIVVIGPCGIVVVEVKNLQQKIVVDRDVWFAERRFSPAGAGLAGERLTHSVSRQLSNQLNALTSSIARIKVRTDIHGLIAINPTCSIRIENPPSYDIVIYDMLPEKIENMTMESSLSEEQIQTLVQYLAKDAPSVTS